MYKYQLGKKNHANARSAPSFNNFRQIVYEKYFFFVGGSKIPIKIKLLGGKECIILKQISRWALFKRFELKTFKFSNFLFIMLNWVFLMLEEHLNVQIWV